ncbi:hypothetical protein HMPREF1318_2667 [Actinomyces massiliensis F0489]|uniref:Uncharacterized protein n=1 Tax=Actinomyces massiliensis F0489 TaxID=1125718 RepID=J0WZK6_9ACTO|nr:hypothetical protein HMPREF1318_2667 [Actinomyces massiliensis F0489]
METGVVRMVAKADTWCVESFVTGVGDVLASYNPGRLPTAA